MYACRSSRMRKRRREGVPRVRSSSCLAVAPSCLVHRGPYEKIGDSYRRLFREFSEKGLGAGLPIREIYLIGPGTILPRSPKSFRTRSNT